MCTNKVMITVLIDKMRGVLQKKETLPVMHLNHASLYSM